jgi:hypothetical protein
MWCFIKEFCYGLRLCWKHWRKSKSRWRCEPGEVSPEARALMLGAVGGVSGPLIVIRGADTVPQEKGDTGSVEPPVE